MRTPVQPLAHRQELRQTTAVQHLRGLLVLAEILEPREEELAQLTRDFQTLLERPASRSRGCAS